MKNWDDLKLRSTAEVLDWAADQPWARAMAACRQDAGWHAEGDVWTHTRQVIAQLEQLSEWSFANDHARFLFYAGTLSSLHYTPREDHCCTVTLMSGLPGSGKDTWLAQQRPGLPVVSLDDLRGVLDVEPTDDQGEVIQLAREKCREHLRAGRHFAFNATNTMRQTRKRWIDLFAGYGARIDLVYIEPPLSTIFERNSRRPRAVPTRAIERLLEKLEPPTWIEAHSLAMIASPASGC
jgi:predicted kinase